MERGRHEQRLLVAEELVLCGNARMLGREGHGGVGGCMLYDGCVYGTVEADLIASGWKGGGLLRQCR